MKPPIPSKCKYCNRLFPSANAVAKHRIADHPETIRIKKRKLGTFSANSPFGQIHKYEAGIRASLLELDTERNYHSNRIKEIDDLCAKYKYLDT